MHIFITWMKEVHFLDGYDILEVMSKLHKRDSTAKSCLFRNMGAFSKEFLAACRPCHFLTAPGDTASTLVAQPWFTLAQTTFVVMPLHLLSLPLSLIDIPLLLQSFIFVSNKASKASRQ